MTVSILARRKEIQMCGLPDQESASQGQGKADVFLLDHGERRGSVLEI